MAVDSLAGAIIAEEAGAGRLELCGSLDGGGVTPSLGFLESVLATVSIPVMVLVRPRTGGFVYDRGEQAGVTRDIRCLLEVGASGVVVGALDAAGDLDLGALDEWVAAAMGAPVTFHRAFDCCRDPRAAFQQLAQRDIQRVLTAGGAGSVMDGLSLLAELSREKTHGGGLAILPGGGLRAAHVSEVIARTGAGEVHTSGRTKDSPLLPGSGEYPGLVLPDARELAAMVQALKEGP